MQKNTYPGKLIVFEGLDGSGQSTQAGLLRDFLVFKDYQVILTKEPTKDSEAGKKIREVLDKKKKVSPEELQKFFAEDRKEHLEKVIIPALKEGKIAISDRYFFSTFAFGTGSGLDLEWLIKLNDNFLLPDLAVILRVSPKVCIERIKARGSVRTLFEEEDRLARVWKVYEVLPDRFENVHIVDGERSVEDVHENIKALLQEKLEL
ncbi:MAG: dTMP kinase [Candidatus Nealsonbacteria bacterium]|nr:dTMP kinase [Candidatus Nealsonbacteria bacterium]